MASTPAIDFPDHTRGDRRRTWLISAAVGVIIISLVLLVVVPILVETRAKAIQRRIAAIATADIEIRELQSALIQELSNLVLFEIAQDTAYLRSYREGRRSEQLAIDRFQAVSAALPLPIQYHFQESIGLIGTWHRSFSLAADSSLIEFRAPPGQALARPAYDEAFTSLNALRGELSRAGAEANRQVSAAERFGIWVSILLALLALLSTALVVLLGRRLSAVAQKARSKSQELMRIQEARTRLLRGMTHDLKNPLGAAALYGELLEMGVHGELQPKQRHVVERIEAALQQALGLVTDLLDLAQAEEGLLKLNPVPIEVSHLLELLIDDLAGPAMAGKLTLELERGEEPGPIEADPVRIRQILENLAGNAIKYTPPGGRVLIRAKRERSGPRSNPAGWVAIEVIDTGPGIAPEDLQRVFEEFVRLRPDGANGSGVGLAISRQLARLMNGEITLRSEVGRGSTFTLWMPRGTRAG